MLLLSSMLSRLLLFLSLQYFFVSALSPPQLEFRSIYLQNDVRSSDSQCELIKQEVINLVGKLSTIQPCTVEHSTCLPEIPKPPKYNPSGAPPQPPTGTISSTTTRPTQHTTTGPTQHTTTGPTQHTTASPSPPADCPECSIGGFALPQSGAYIASWYAYKKFYMGLQNLNVFDKKMSPEMASSEYVFFPYHMRRYASKLTHIYYAFWKISEKCHVELDDPDAAWWGAVNNVQPVWIPVPQGACKGIMNDMMALKSEFPHLKMLISVGGWTLSRYFSKCAATAESRHIIIKTATYRLNEMDPNYGKSDAVWNGVDLDWEFPEATNGLYPDHSDDDWENFIKLIGEFKEYANKESRDQFLVTAAVGVGETLTQLVSKPDTANRYCDIIDQVNLMTYDLHGKWDKTTGHNANFCKDQRSGDRSLGLSVAGSVYKLLDAGCLASKISLGIPNYSPAWTRIAPGDHRNGLFTTASSDQFVGWSTFSDKDDSLVPQGIISYWDMKSVVKEGDFEVFSYDCPQDNGVIVPVKHVYSASRQAFSCYEDAETVRAKVKWAKSLGLGGYFFWDSQQDKNGEHISEAFSVWGLKEHPATGAYSCKNERKPDFSKDPFTGSVIKVVCKLEGDYVDVVAGGSCNAAKAIAQQKCGDKTPVVMGGARQWAPQTCLNVCSPSWGGTGNMVMVGDRVYFTCT